MTLNQNEKTEDVGERGRALKACHQRCADRTLKVLEKNGSIFIKLGQHLVGCIHKSSSHCWERGSLIVQIGDGHNNVSQLLTDV